MSTYFQQQLPASDKEGVAEVSVCSDQGTWATTVIFQDKVVYHYTLDLAKPAVSLASVSTEGQRQVASSNDDLDLHCLGCRDGRSFSGFIARGDYRFQMRGGSVVGSVQDGILRHQLFDNTVKQRLAVAAMAVRAAIAEHRQYVPVETSWGLMS